MPYQKGVSREQITLMPDVLEDYVSEENPVRVIDAFVERLDMGAHGFKAEAAVEGRPGYDPRDMLKIYIYGYQNKIRSSRKLQVECGRNVEVMWLTGKLIPDFRCIADFRKNNAAAIKQVFHAFVTLCNQAGLLSKEFVAIDGSKFRAVNSEDNAYVKKTVEKNISELDEKITRYLTELDKNDSGEEKAPNQMTADEIECLIQHLESRKSRLEGIFDALEKSGENQICTVDPEARLMKTRDGFRTCFNVQTAVEGNHHLVVDFQVTSEGVDQELLELDVQSAKRALGVDTLECAADKGYRSDTQVLRCLLNGDMPNVYTHNKQDCYSFTFERTNMEATPEMLSSRDPAVVLQCVYAGVLPDALKKRGVELKVKKGGSQHLYMDIQTGELVTRAQTLEKINIKRKKPLSYFFVRNPDTDTVTCPMGQTLIRAGNSHPHEPHYSQNARYTRPSVCLKCKNKCTAGERRNITFKPGQLERRATFYDDCFSESLMSRTKGKYVPVLLPNPDKVVLRFYPDYEKLRLRKQLVEHPYGTVKRWNDGSYLLLKGKLKASADLALLFLGYNFKRVINLIGTKEMLAMMSA